MYVDNLYDSFFVPNAKTHDSLHIISGYASGSFLRRVKSNFPHLKIELYIGMAHQGIPIYDHTDYLSLMNTYDDIKVYYQVFNEIATKPTYMKIYDFSNQKGKKSFVGSANFSENGFFHNREIIVQTDNVISNLFTFQRENSILCSDSEIETYISFIDEDIPVTLVEENALELRKNDQYHVSESHSRTTPSYIRENKNVFWQKKSQNPRYLQTFDIQIAYNARTNPRWKKIGINGSLEGDYSVLKVSPQGKLFNFFDEGTIFTLYSDDGKQFEAELVGTREDSLALIGESWYDYVTERLDIEKGIPLSNEMLNFLGYEYLKFTRLSRTEYGFLL